jgi:undecaprenyl diphosphate synthase
VIGEIEKLDSDLQTQLKFWMKKMVNNNGLQLTLAVSYGSRKELVYAARELALECASGKLRPEEITEEVFQSRLWTSQLGELSEVDLVIRTSGEQRISNFLLWQSAYAEFIFTDICWPDFSSEHFKAAIEEYAQRERRFGGLRVELESPPLLAESGTYA